MISRGRFIVAVLLGEALPVLVLVILVAIAGPADPTEAGEFARRAGAWVGPVGGALAVLVLTRWAGAASSRPVIQGAAIGLTVAALDLGILFSSEEPFQWLFVLSNGGKVIAGMVGGWLAARAAAAQV